MDFRDDDLLQEGWNFFAVTQASVYPLEPLGFAVERQVPLLLLQRSFVEAYQVPASAVGSDAPDV